MTTKKYTLVEAYDALSTLISNVKVGNIPADIAWDELTSLAKDVNSLPGLVLKVPTYTELLTLVPDNDSEYGSSEEPYYEESYESSAC